MLNYKIIQTMVQHHKQSFIFNCAWFVTTLTPLRYVLDDIGWLYCTFLQSNEHKPFVVTVSVSLSMRQENLQPSPECSFLSNVVKQGHARICKGKEMVIKRINFLIFICWRGYSAWILIIPKQVVLIGKRRQREIGIIIKGEKNNMRKTHWKKCNI